MTSPDFAQEKIVLGTALKSPMSTRDRRGAIDQIIVEAFARLDIKIEILHLPPERSLKNANAGIIDGDMYRIGGLVKSYPNLIQVPERLYFAEFLVAAKYLDVNNIESWEGLSPYSTAIVIGHKIMEERLYRVTNLSKVENQEILFNLLDNGRAEYAVVLKSNVLNLLKKPGLSNIKLSDRPLEVRDMFLYLHKKHRMLVPRIAEVLRQMKAEGIYDRIISQILRPYIKN